MSIKAVFVFPNGIVAVTDENGQQIAELQGPFKDVRLKILEAADDDTEFNGWPERRTND